MTKPCSLSGQYLTTTFLLSFSGSVSFIPFLHCLHCPLHTPSLALVKQQGPCDRKRRKLPIKEDMYLTGESQEGTGVCIKAKERVIWRYLSWTGQFPVSGTGQKYPETRKSCRRGKDTPPPFSCNLLHCNQAQFWACSINYGSNKTVQAKHLMSFASSYCLMSGKTVYLMNPANSTKACNCIWLRQTAFMSNTIQKI